MANNKLSEFLAVLVSALVVGVVGILIARYLQGNVRFAAVIVMIALAVLVLRALPRRVTHQPLTIEPSTILQSGFFFLDPVVELHVVQLLVEPVMAHKLKVPAALHYFAAVHDQDLVRLGDRRESVRDHE